MHRALNQWKPFPAFRIMYFALQQDAAARRGAGQSHSAANQRVSPCISSGHPTNHGVGGMMPRSPNTSTTAPTYTTSTTRITTTRNRLIVALPERMRALLALLFFSEMLLCIALIVVGICKILANSSRAAYSHGIYLHLVTLPCVFAGLFATRNKSQPQDFDVHRVLGYITIVGLAIILYLNVSELEEDSVQHWILINKPINQLIPTPAPGTQTTRTSVTQFNVTTPDTVTLTASTVPYSFLRLKPAKPVPTPYEYRKRCHDCHKLNASVTECRCYNNVVAMQAEATSIALLTLTLACFIVTIGICSAALSQTCGITHETTKITSSTLVRTTQSV